jgi:hypothetical protein
MIPLTRRGFDHPASAFVFAAYAQDSSNKAVYIDI